MDTYSNEYKNYDNIELLKSRNSTTALFLACLVFSIVFLGGFALFIYDLIIGEFPGEMAIVIIICFVCGIMFAFGTVYEFKVLRCIIAEIKSREVANADYNQAKKHLIKGATVVAILIIITIIVVYSAFGGGSSARCRECGKKGVYSEYGYCYSCYQEVYNQTKKNGK